MKTTVSGIPAHCGPGSCAYRPDAIPKALDSLL